MAQSNIERIARNGDDVTDAERQWLEDELEDMATLRYRILKLTLMHLPVPRGTSVEIASQVGLDLDQLNDIYYGTIQRLEQAYDEWRPAAGQS